MKVPHRLAGWLTLLALLSTFNLQLSTSYAQGTAFTYQGRLTDGGSPANGLYDLDFTLYDVPSGGVQKGPSVIALALPVTNGNFQATLDFGSMFPGDARWLLIWVRTNGGGAYLPLYPRQPLTPSPYAIMANSASNLLGSVPAGQLSGRVSLAQLPAAVVTNNETSVSLGSLTLNGNLNLPATTGNSGIIYAGGSTLIQSYGTGNFFAGAGAGNLTISGAYNVGVGSGALVNNTTGSGNIALGALAGLNLTSGDNNIDIGNPGFAGESGVIRLGTAGTHTNTILVGNISIGNIRPIAQAEIFGSGQTTAALTDTGSRGGMLMLNTDGGGAGNGGAVVFGNQQSHTANSLGFAAIKGLLSNGGGNTAGDLAFATRNANADTALTERMRITGSGNVGIGKTNPATALDVNGTVTATGFSSTANTMRFYAPNDMNIAAENKLTIEAAGNLIFRGTTISLDGTVQAGTIQALGNLYMNDQDIYWRGDSYHGAGWYGAGKPFAGATPDGPVLYGYGGGGLGIWGGNSSTNLVLQWTSRTSLLMGTCTNAASYAIAFGKNTTAGADYATVAGGVRNTASGAGAFVGGGGYDGSSINGNTASGAGATVSGGTQNVASNSRATVSGGHNNTASGTYSMIPGGAWCAAAGAGSFAAGEAAKALHDGAFVWADTSILTDVTSTSANSVTMRAAGGYRLFSNSGMSAGVSLAPGGTAWATISDRSAKKNFTAVDGEAVLDKLASVPVQQWNYRWEDDGSPQHLGPMAQDFKAAFYPGADNKTITTLDFDGVELAAIQGLNRKLDAETATLRAENAALKARLDKLEHLISMKNGGGQ